MFTFPNDKRDYLKRLVSKAPPIPGSLQLTLTPIVPPYCIIFDTSQFSGEIDELQYVGNVEGIIIRLNGVWPQQEGNSAFYKDSLFDKQWKDSEKFIRSPYFLFSPFHTGQQNYDYLLANCPAEVKTVFVDVEIINPNIQKDIYGKRLNDFYNLASKKWHIVIYTGGWFIKYVTPWPNCEYWWSQYPKSMYPDIRTPITWSELDKKIQALSWDTPVNYAKLFGITNVKLWQCSGDRLILPGSIRAMDINVFPTTKEEYAKWIGQEIPVPPPPDGGTMNILTVPYISQIVQGSLEHNNDCGPTSSLMTLQAYKLAMNMTVDSYYNSLQPSGDVPISVGQLQTSMASYGLKNEWRVDLQDYDIFNYLADTKPLVALIHYGTLVDAHYTQKTGFRGAHYVVLSGIDIKNVNMHDPYRDDGVQNVEVPITIFMTAWQDASLDGNPVRGAIMPLLPIQDLSVPVVGTKYMLATNINGLNVRSQPTSSSTLLRTIWRTSATTPTFYGDSTTTNSLGEQWTHLVDGGYVFTNYITLA